MVYASDRKAEHDYVLVLGLRRRRRVTTPMSTIETIRLFFLGGVRTAGWGRGGRGGGGGEEATCQIAFADRIIVNKVDLLGRRGPSPDHGGDDDPHRRRISRGWRVEGGGPRLDTRRRLH